MILLLNTSSTNSFKQKCTFIVIYCVGHIKLWGNVKRSTQTKVKDKYTQKTRTKTNGVARTEFSSQTRVTDENT